MGVCAAQWDSTGPPVFPDRILGYELSIAGGSPGFPSCHLGTDVLTQSPRHGAEADAKRQLLLSPLKT